MVIDRDKNIKIRSLFKYHVTPIILSTKLPRDRQKKKQAIALSSLFEIRNVSRKNPANINS